MPFFYFDPTYILVIIAYVIALIAQTKVKSTYAKYSGVLNRAGLSGADAADAVLRSGGAFGVRIEGTQGELTDHFDPKVNVIRLSEGVYNKRTVAAAGVAAHEAGHALQYAEGYSLIKLRAAIIPVCNIAANLSWPLIIIGLFLSYSAGLEGDIGITMIHLGIFAFSFAVLFQLITLPVELNASRRALAALRSDGRFTEDELQGAKKVLTAAALTYVAALAGSILQLLRILIIASSRSKRK